MQDPEYRLDVHDLVAEIRPAGLNESRDQRREPRIGRGWQKQRVIAEDHATRSEADEFVRILCGEVTNARDDAPGHLLGLGPVVDLECSEEQLQLGSYRLPTRKRRTDPTIRGEPELVTRTIDAKAVQVLANEVQEGPISAPKSKRRSVDLIVLRSDPT